MTGYMSYQIIKNTAVMQIKFFRLFRNNVKLVMEEQFRFVESLCFYFV